MNSVDEATLETLLDIRDLLFTQKEYDFLKKRYMEEERDKVLGDLSK